MKKLFYIFLCVLFIPVLAYAGWRTLSDGTLKPTGTNTNVEIEGSVSVGAASGSATLTGYDLSAPAYGVRWNASTDTYEKGVLVNGYFCISDYADYPIQAQMKRCILSDAGEVQYYLCPTDSTKKADCSTAADLTGADGQVMVEIPAFHYLQYQHDDYRYFLIAAGPFTVILPDGTTTNSAIHPAFYKGGSSTPSDYRYVGAYEGSMYDASAGAMTAVADIHQDIYASGDKLCSVSGQYPKTNETITEFRAMAEERGTGWHLYDNALHAALSVLYLTEYADFNSQSKIGNGRVSLTNGDWVASETWDGTNYGYIGKCGKSDSDGNATNADSSATDLTTVESPAYMSYRGIENWWGNVWQFMDGANINNDGSSSKLYLCNDYTNYASDTSTNYALAGNLAEADGWPTDIMDATGIWPSSVGGSSSTYLCDYFYTYYDSNPAGGWRVARVGGYAIVGASVGAFFVATYGASSYASASLGGRLCY